MSDALKPSRDALNYFSLLFALLVFVGESIVVFTSDKIFALSADDYIAATALLIFAARPFNIAGLAGLLAAWSFATGGLWVMLIYRMPPLGEGERLYVLGSAFTAALFGLLWSTWRLHGQVQERA